MAPQRIQRKRTKGWRMPENTVVVTRGSRFGNPFAVGVYAAIGRGGDGLAYTIGDGPSPVNIMGFDSGELTLVLDAADAVERFRLYRQRYRLKPQEIEQLRGKNLACWCRLDQPCHADVLLELANEVAR